MSRAALVRPVWRLGFARSCHDGQCFFHKPMTTATPARIAVIRSTSQRSNWAGDSFHQGISYGLLQSQSQCGSSMRLHLVPKSHFEKKLSRKSWTQGLRCCATATQAEGEPKVRGSSPLLKWEKGGGMVHSLATVHDSAIIESGAIVEAHANIGANTHVSSGCIVGPNVSVGASSTLGYNVVLQNCSLGNSCILHPGVCIGQDGFGFLENSAGEIMKKPQLLRVQIGNHVEIGANSCIDRGSWRDTEIGDHTKIDNLVQIGHNAIIGRGCMLCGQVGVAGSATIGDYVVLGGKAGVSDHVTITSRVRVAAKSGVISSIDIAGDYAGFPAVPAKEWRKQVVAIRRVGRSSSKESILEAEE